MQRKQFDFPLESLTYNRMGAKRIAGSGMGPFRSGLIGGANRVGYQESDNTPGFTWDGL